MASATPSGAARPEGRSVPAPIAVLLMVATLVGAAYFVREGVSGSQTGLRRLSGRLLSIQARTTAPLSFELPHLDGTTWSLPDKRVVFVNFWATWCPPCVEEMPSLLALNRKLKDHPEFEMLLISTDSDWSPVRKFFGDKPPGVPVLLDAEGGLAEKYGTTVFPETYLIVDGQIVAFIEGPRDWDAWYSEAYIRSFFGG